MSDESPQPAEAPAEWVWMTNGAGSVVRFPNDPTVIEHYEARGWELTDDPAEAPFVPAKTDVEPDEPWVDLVHDGIDGPCRFPNDPVALKGAYDAGWTHPAPEPEGEPKDEPDQKPAKRTTKRASSAPATDQEE